MRAAALLFATAFLVFADGGAVLLHKDATPFLITVFESPTPPRAGLIDFSVLLQSGEGPDPVLDADVGMSLTRGNSRIEAHPIRDQAQNKMLYAASVRLDEPGEWNYTVTVRPAGNTSVPISVAGVIGVASAETKPVAYAGYLALPFLCLGIFALHQWLRYRKRVRS